MMPLVIAVLVILGTMPSLFFVAFVILAVIIIVYNAIDARKRREDLSKLAGRLNLNFNPDKDYDIPARFNFIKEFAEGGNRYATNILSGVYQQYEVMALDYHYETHTYDKEGEHTQHYWFSFFILTIPAAFPNLTIRREGLFTKIAEVFGYQAIKFESAEFSNTFCVRSPDKKFAYDVCNTKMMEYLLINRDLSIEIENEVIALVFSSRISVEEFEKDLQRLIEIRARLPLYLFTQNA